MEKAEYVGYSIGFIALAWGIYSFFPVIRSNLSGFAGLVRSGRFTFSMPALYAVLVVLALVILIYLSLNSDIWRKIYAKN